MTGPIVDIIVWPGSGSTPIGKTPFEIFDDDDDFVDDAPKLAKWICTSLGYPVMAVELTDEMVYAQFEQSIIEFSSVVNEFNMREQMLALQGVSTSTDVTGKLIKSSPLPYIIEISQMYGTEAEVGGEVELKKGFVTLEAGEQDYDLQELWSSVSESGNRMEIRRVYHERTPAINRFFDPFAGSAGMGLGIQNVLSEFGWGNFSIASQYLLMPIYETLLRIQAIEFNDQIRRSQYSFEIHNNNLRVIPLPNSEDQGIKLWFEYYVTTDKAAAQVSEESVASDFSNVPYDNVMYENINAVGRRWIWKYALSLCKIILGGIRSKYDVIPIPNSEMRLDGLTLRQEGFQEIEMLRQELRETLVEAGKERQMEKARLNEENIAEIMKRIPAYIYVR